MTTIRRNYTIGTLAGLLAVWIVGGAVLVPKIALGIYTGKVLPFLNKLISGQTSHSLHVYVADVRNFFLLGFAALVLALGVVLLAPPKLPVWHALATAWRRYWFRPTATVYLGLTRIVCVAIVLMKIWSLPVLFSQLARLPGDLYHPLLITRMLLLPFGHGYQPPEAAIVAVYWLTFAIGWVALVGFRTNVSLLLLAAGYTFLTAYKYSFGEFHHNDAIMAIALFLFALSPSGRSFSLDAYLASRRQGRGSWLGLGEKSAYAAWPLLLIQALLALIYVNAAINKLYLSDGIRGGIEWMNGSTLGYYVVRDGVWRGSHLAGLLLGHPGLLQILSVLSVFFEATFWLVLLKPKLAWVYVPIGFGFHMGNVILQIADFYEFMALYVTFMPQLVGAWQASPLMFLRQAADPETGQDPEFAGARSPARGIVLFDGECNFCNGWMRFIFAQDPRGKFHFGALQSPVGRKLLAQRGLDSESLDSIVLLTPNRCHRKSAAVIHILWQLGLPWAAAGFCLVVPRYVRDFVYDWVARHRYQWFGKREFCAIPSSEMRQRIVSMP